MTFYRTDVLIGRESLKIDLAAMIRVQGAKEADNPQNSIVLSPQYTSALALHREDQSDRGDAKISARKVPLEGE